MSRHADRMSNIRKLAQSHKPIGNRLTSALYIIADELSDLREDLRTFENRYVPYVKGDEPDRFTIGQTKGGKATLADDYLKTIDSLARDPARPVAILDVAEEINRARDRFPAMRSPHEGYAIILEELDELWEEVQGWGVANAKKRMRAEAIQVAAMAIRFVEDVCDQ